MDLGLLLALYTLFVLAVGYDSADYDFAVGFDSAV